MRASTERSDLTLYFISVHTVFVQLTYSLGAVTYLPLCLLYLYHILTCLLARLPLYCNCVTNLLYCTCMYTPFVVTRGDAMGHIIMAAETIITLTHFQCVAFSVLYSVYC